MKIEIKILSKFSRIFLSLKTIDRVSINDHQSIHILLQSSNLNKHDTILFGRESAGVPDKRP